MTSKLTTAELIAMENRFRRMGGRGGGTTATSQPVSAFISNAELIAMEARRAAADRKLALLKYRSQNS